MKEHKAKDHAALAEGFIKDEERVNWHDGALWYIREKRDKASKQIPEWEQLREAASAIKNNVISNLYEYLLQFEANLTKNGVIVHWAENAEEHNEIVYSILSAKKINQMVKSKSMLTEECHLNEYLEERGIEVINSDLGEYIQQIDKEPPSHIVLPCIHKRKEEIGELFHRHLGTEKGLSDPTLLTRVARKHLRNVFLTRRAALTGVNFAVAETGEYIVCTNEGNAEGQPITIYSPQCNLRGRGRKCILYGRCGRTRSWQKRFVNPEMHQMRQLYEHMPGIQEKRRAYHNTISPIGAILAPNIDMNSMQISSPLRCVAPALSCPINIHDQPQVETGRS